jgi:copper transport protein
VAVAGNVALFTGGGGAKPAVVTLVGTDLEVRAELTPGRTGTNELHLYVFDRDHRQVDVASMTVRMVRSGTSAPVDVALVRAGQNHFLSAAIEVDDPGVWIVHADVTTADKVSEQIDGSVDIGRG